MEVGFVSYIVILKEHCNAEIATFRSAYFHVISPNATKYTILLNKTVV